MGLLQNDSHPSVLRQIQPKRFLFKCSEITFWLNCTETGDCQLILQ